MANAYREFAALEVVAISEMKQIVSDRSDTSPVIFTGEADRVAKRLGR